MHPSTACPQCGKVLPPDAPQGLCPACLAGAILAQPSAPADSDRFVPTAEFEAPATAPTASALAGPESPAAVADATTAPGQRIRYFGDYELLGKSRAAVWGSSTKRDRSA